MATLEYKYFIECGLWLARSKQEGRSQGRAGPWMLVGNDVPVETRG